MFQGCDARRSASFARLSASLARRSASFTRWRASSSCWQRFIRSLASFIQSLAFEFRSLAFEIQQPAFLGQLPFSRFPCFSFSSKHDVVVNTSCSGGDSSVSKYLVQHVNVNVLSPTQRPALGGYCVGTRFRCREPYRPGYANRHHSKQKRKPCQLPDVCQKALFAIPRVSCAGRWLSDSPFPTYPLYSSINLWMSRKQGPAVAFRFRWFGRRSGRGRPMCLPWCEKETT